MYVVRCLDHNPRIGCLTLNSKKIKRNALKHAPKESTVVMGADLLLVMGWKRNSLDSSIDPTRITFTQQSHGTKTSRPGFAGQASRSAKRKDRSFFGKHPKSDSTPTQRTFYHVFVFGCLRLEVFAMFAT